MTVHQEGQTAVSAARVSRSAVVTPLYTPLMHFCEISTCFSMFSTIGTSLLREVAALFCGIRCLAGLLYPKLVLLDPAY